MSYIKQRTALIIFTHNFRMDHNHHMEELPNFAAFHSKREIQTKIHSLKYTTTNEKKQQNVTALYAAWTNKLLT